MCWIFTVRLVQVCFYFSGECRWKSLFGQQELCALCHQQIASIISQTSKCRVVYLPKPLNVSVLQTANGRCYCALLFSIFQYHCCLMFTCPGWRCISCLEKNIRRWRKVCVYNNESYYSGCLLFGFIQVRQKQGKYNRNRRNITIHFSLFISSLICQGFASIKGENYINIKSYPNRCTKKHIHCMYSKANSMF